MTFDDQMNAIFSGDGKAITPDAVRFMQAFNLALDGSVYSCPVAWQEDNRIIANIRQQLPDGSTIEGLQGCRVSDDYAQAIQDMIEHIENPPLNIPAGKARNYE